MESTALQRNVEIALILLGVVLLVTCLPHVIYDDGEIRFQMLSALLERGEVSKYFYSFVGPLFSAPLWYLGRAAGTSEWWCARFNVLVFGLAILALHRLMRGVLDSKTANRFLLLLIAASMFPFHVTTYYAEVFTACLVAVGLAAAIFRSKNWGWALIVVGVLNTPAALGGLGVLCLIQSLRTKRWRYLGLVVLALALNFGENWLRRGSFFADGRGEYSVARTVMPYSGMPGFSYPMFFGVLSILFSFGRGLVFFSPGLFLSARQSLAEAGPSVRRYYELGIAFVVGLILMYSKWYAWYGGVFWGPRFFLFASVPAALVLALRLGDRGGSVGARVVTAGALLLSSWVAIDGAAFGTNNLQICTEGGYRYEHLCWYAPEFSALWRPFVAPSPVSDGKWAFAGYCVLVHIYVAAPLYRGLLRDLAGALERFGNELRRPVEPDGGRGGCPEATGAAP